MHEGTKTAGKETGTLDRQVMQVYPRPHKRNKTHSGVKSRKTKSSTVSLQVRNTLPLTHHEALNEQRASCSPLCKGELIKLDYGFQKLLVE